MIIDHQFYEHTLSFYWFMSIVYLVGFLLPFIYSVFSPDPTHVYYSSTLCLFTQGVVLLLEVIKILGSYRVDLYFIDAVLSSVIIFYLIVRI
jgi:hypothetical protein